MSQVAADGGLSGGVAILWRTTLHVMPQCELPSPGERSIAVSLHDSKHGVVDVVSVYGYVGKQVDTFDMLSDIVSTLSARRSPFIVLGEFNIPSSECAEWVRGSYPPSEGYLGGLRMFHGRSCSQQH